ncbi:hypothetical protein AO287_19470 [Pseudomonas savastanoi]|uniref:Uncharacterized protein n=2 Tax=Pseudomonas savastanoi TaxID=29438 RepID=A0AAW3LW28_PSESS|nr:hypothetical protein AO287_19470 [Pseudomonas savastanoi]
MLIRLGLPNATRYNWLSHAEIRDADKARAAYATAGGDVGACQANVTRETDELDKARDYELKERKRAIQLQSFKDGGWTLGEYNKALFDDYFASKGVDQSQVKNTIRLCSTIILPAKV